MSPASIVSPASSSTWPTATMRPSRMPTSARRPGAPVPSTTVPPRLTLSSIATTSSPSRGSARLALPGAHVGASLRVRVGLDLAGAQLGGALGVLGRAPLPALGLERLLVDRCHGRDPGARGLLDLDRRTDLVGLVLVEELAHHRPARRVA